VGFYCSGMSAKDAYLKAGYKTSKLDYAYRNASEILRNPDIRQAIDEQLDDFTKNVADKIKQSTEEAFEKLLSLMRGAENEFVQFNVGKDILDRAGLKPTDKLEQKHSGNIKIEFEYFDSPKETEDDIDDESETTPE
jgi:hypothetical protein